MIRSNGAIFCLGEKYTVALLPEAISRNEVRGCAVGISHLVGFVHRNSRSPEADEQALARQCVRASGVHVKQVDESRGGCSHGCEVFRHVSDEHALEWIVQIDEQRSSRPLKFRGVLLNHTNPCLWPPEAAPSRDVSFRDA